MIIKTYIYIQKSDLLQSLRNFSSLLQLNDSLWQNQQIKSKKECLYEKEKVDNSQEKQFISRKINPTGSSYSLSTKCLSDYTDNIIDNKPSFNSKVKTYWSNSDDCLLLKLKDEDNLNWKEINSYFQGKNEKSCFYRYNKLKNISIKWTREEDELLLKLLEAKGEDFDQISAFFKNKSIKDIEQRYYKKIKPQILNFSQKESDLVLRAYNGLIFPLTKSQDLISLIRSKGLYYIKKHIELKLKLKNMNIDPNKQEFLNIASLYYNANVLSNKENNILISNEDSYSTLSTHNENIFITNNSSVIEDDINTFSTTKLINHHSDDNFCFSSLDNWLQLSSDEQLHLNLDVDNKTINAELNVKINNLEETLLTLNNRVNNEYAAKREYLCNKCLILLKKFDEEENRYKTKLNSLTTFHLFIFQDSEDLKSQLLERAEIINNLISLSKEKLSLLNNYRN